MYFHAIPLRCTCSPSIIAQFWTENQFRILAKISPPHHPHHNQLHRYRWHKRTSTVHDIPSILPTLIPSPPHHIYARKWTEIISSQTSSSAIFSWILGYLQVDAVFHNPIAGVPLRFAICFSLFPWCHNRLNVTFATKWKIVPNEIENFVPISPYCHTPSCVTYTAVVWQVHNTNQLRYCSQIIYITLQIATHLLFFHFSKKKNAKQQQQKILKKKKD